MRPTTVRFAHTNRSATRRRSGFATAPKTNKVTPSVTLVEKVVTPPLTKSVTKAA